MRTDQAYFRFIFSNISLIPGLILILLIFPGSLGKLSAQQSDKSKIIQQIELEYTPALIYDNNILKYSDKYLNRFKNQQDEGRFHIKTYDDLIISQSLELTTSLRIFPKYRSKFILDFARQQYFKNDIRSMNEWGAGFQQILPQKMMLNLFYNNIPYFYVRHYRDKEWVNVYGYTPESFQPFSFRKEELGGYIQKTMFKNTRLRLSFAGSRYFHNEHYTEYDCNNFLAGVTLFQPIGKKLKTEISYQYISSAAKGFDASYETAETSQGPDASYVEDRFNLTLTRDLPRIKKINHSIEVEGGYWHRAYLSAFSAVSDPLHAGRTDHSFRVLLTYSVKIRSRLKMALLLNSYSRNTKTNVIENKEYVSDEKDFQQLQYGLKLTYNLKLLK